MRISRILAVLLPTLFIFICHQAKGQDFVVCPDEIPGFDFLSDYNGHYYFISNEKEEWPDARTIALDLGGYLCTISDAEENAHLFSLITEEVFIGYNDANEDGDYTWSNGEAASYTNYGEDTGNPYTRMNSWDGKWAFEEMFVSRKFILEFSCGDEIVPCNCPQDDDPVCGTDFEDYANPCEAVCANMHEYYIGKCDDLFGPDLQITGFRGQPSETNLGAVEEYFIDITNSGNRNAWDRYEILVYLSPDSIYGNGNDAQVGDLPTGDTHITTIENVRGEIGIGGKVLPGNNYIIVVIDAENEIREINEDNNVYIHGEAMFVENTIDPNIDCPYEIHGYELLGQYDNHRYFLSDFDLTWEEAQAEAHSFGASLASISTQLENEFLQNSFNGIAFIGLNDLDGDGEYDWESGEEQTYQNQNGELTLPYGHFNGFNGTWGEDEAFTSRKFVLEFNCNNIEFTEGYDPCAPVEINFFKEITCLDHNDDGTFSINGKHRQNFYKNTYTENGQLLVSKLGTSFERVDYDLNFENIVGTDRFGNVHSSVKIDQVILNTYSGDQSGIALVEKRAQSGYNLIAYHNFPEVSSGPDGVESIQNLYLHELDEEGNQSNSTLYLGKVTYVDPPSSGNTYLHYRKIINMRDGATRFYYSIVYANSINSTERSETYFIHIDENRSVSEIQDDDFDCDFGPNGYKIENTHCDLVYRFNNVCWGGNGLVSSYEIRDYNFEPYRLLISQDFDRSYSAGIEWHNIAFYEDDQIFNFSNQVEYLTEDLFPGDHNVKLVGPIDTQEFEAAFLIGDPQSIYKTEEEAYKILSIKNGKVALSTIACPDDCECPELDEPVCGYNGEIYANACVAECDGEYDYYEGANCEENLPDLSISEFCCLPESTKIGNTETFEFDLSNDGTLNLDANVLINIYLSEDQVLGNEDDVHIGEKIMQYIPAGFLNGITAEIYFVSVTTGDYYLVLDVDPNNKIQEINEQNNYWISPEVIYVGDKEVIVPDSTCTIELAVSDQTVCVTALDDHLQLLLLNEDGYFKNIYDGEGMLLSTTEVDIDEVYPNQIYLDGNRLIEETHSGELVHSVNIDPELASAYGQNYNGYGDVCKNEDGTYWLSGVLSKPPGNPDQGFPETALGTDQIWLHLLNQSGQQIRRIKVREIEYTAADFYYLQEDHYQVLSLIPLANGGVELLDLQATYNGPNYNYLSTQFDKELNLIDSKLIYNGGIFAGYDVDISECQNKLYQISIYGVGFPNNAYRLIDYSVFPPKTILDYQDAQGIGSFVNTTSHQSNYYFHDGKRLSFGDLLYEAVSYFPRRVTASYHDENDGLIKFVDFYFKEQPQAILKNEDESFTVVYYDGEHTYLDNSSCYNEEDESLDCLEEIPGFTFIGENEHSTYFISNEYHTWANAHYVASSYPGTYLATISSGEENEFIYNLIEEEAFIGLNDRDDDGVYEWIRNEDEQFENFGNTAEDQFIYLNPVNGNWEYTSASDKKKFIMEMPCIQDSIVDPLSVDYAKGSELNKIDVYPNPSSSDVYIDLSDYKGLSFSLDVFDSNGRLIWSQLKLDTVTQRVIKVELDGHTAGVYCLKINGSDGSNITRRIVLF